MNFRDARTPEHDSPSSGTPHGNGGIKDHDQISALGEEGVHAVEEVPLIQGDNAADVVPNTTKHRGQSNALDTIQDILLILNLIKDEKTFQMDDRQDSDETTNTNNDSNIITAKSIRDGSDDSSDKENSPPEDDDDVLLHIDMPNTTAGTTTFEYECALRNRIKAPKMSRGGEYDTHAYTPTFIHDCLMLPGTLAKLIGKHSSLDIVRRMTPAHLSGFHAHVDPKTHLPCLLQSQELHAYVQGIVIFGQSTGARHQIHAHYRPYTRRVKVQVEIEVLSPHPVTNRWTLVRKKIWANVWLWSEVNRTGSTFRSAASRWTIEEYLAGTLAGPQILRIGRDGSIGSDYGGDSTEDKVGSVDESGGQREAIVQPEAELQADKVYDGLGYVDQDEDWFW